MQMFYYCSWKPLSLRWGCGIVQGPVCSPMACGTDGSFWLWEDCARVHIKEFVLILWSGGLTQSDVLLLHFYLFFENFTQCVLILFIPFLHLSPALAPSLPASFMSKNKTKPNPNPKPKIKTKHQNQFLLPTWSWMCSFLH